MRIIFPDDFKLLSFTYISRFVLFITALSNFVFELQLVEYFIAQLCVLYFLGGSCCSNVVRLGKYSIVVSILPDSQYKLSDRVQWKIRNYAAFSGQIVR